MFDEDSLRVIKIIKNLNGVFFGILVGIIEEFGDGFNIIIGKDVVIYFVAIVVTECLNVTC